MYNLTNIFLVWSSKQNEKWQKLGGIQDKITLITLKNRSPVIVSYGNTSNLTIIFHVSTVWIFRYKAFSENGKSLFLIILGWFKFCTSTTMCFIFKRRDYTTLGYDSMVEGKCLFSQILKSSILYTLVVLFQCIRKVSSQLIMMLLFS